ncbi:MULTISPECIES: cupin domain-containing protein [Burkholderia]|uniref:cupin domain-containing protein n=1 Tax=Burkholderia TaxID=32008 RepID=UPI0007557D97|nr:MULTISPECIES: cupin domain-containing protein [Burkholderia]KVK80751.1 cupin [Burkholderia sp. MSMB1498]KWZ47981.1 cupin [Burkholderia savannae]
MPNTPPELLKAADIEAMDVVRSVHTLNENAVRLKKPLSDKTGITQFGFLIITIMPGHESSEYHRHLYEEECVYILSGYGEATIGERTFPVGPGDFLGFAQRGPAHVLKNSGDVPLVFIAAGQRLEQDVCDYPRLGKRLFVAGEVEGYVELEGDGAA